VKSIKMTSVETDLPDIFPGLQREFKVFSHMDMKLLSFPAGTPVNLVMNLNPKYVPQLVEAYIKGVLKGEPRSHFKGLIDRRRDAGMQAMKAKMLELNTCPDFIEDRGHYFGAQLSDKEKRALIEYVKYM